MHGGRHEHAGRRALIVLLVVGGLVTFPTLGPSGEPPTTARWRASVDRWAPAGDGWHQSDPLPSSAVLVAVGDPVADRRVQVRSRSGDRWGPWLDAAPAGDHAPDPGTAEARQVQPDVSDPVWLGSSDAVQVRTDAPEDPVVLHAVDVSGGSGLAWQPPEVRATPGAAHALPVWPPMVPRTSWDPNGECRPSRPAYYADKVERVYVHHTAIFPHYAPHESDDLVRAICVNHVEARNFGDIGYNFVIDQYGVIFQGRSGGILRPVVGAHAAGFNRGSVGIAVIGNFEANGVPDAALDALDRLMAWLHEWHELDPYAVTPHESTGGATTRFPEGEVVHLPTIVGHSDTGLDTLCPGIHLYEHVRGRAPAADRVAALLRERGVDVAGEQLPPAAAEGEPQVPVSPAGESPRGPRVDIVMRGVANAFRLLGVPGGARIDAARLTGNLRLPTAPPAPHDATAP